MKFDFYLASYLCVCMCMYLPLYMNHVHEVTAQAIRRMGSPELELKAVCESPDVGAGNQTKASGGAARAPNC